MKKIDLGLTGSNRDDSSRPNWQALIQDTRWQSLVHQLVPDSCPTDIQAKSLAEGALLTTRRNLILTAPTNSGKSLLAYLALLRGVLRGNRVLLLVPLRAIAEEKYEELRQLSSSLEPVLNKKIGVVISTGAYRLDEETLQSPPPDEGELVVATPERIESIIRNPDFDPWIESIGVVCADEAHLLGDQTRGATLEYVLTSLKCLQVPPQLLLMSATLGDTTVLQEWLEPCDALVSSVREPPLHQWAAELEEEEDPKAVVIELTGDILANPAHSLLVFVYQIAWANSLAKELTTQLGALCGVSGAQPYHSRLKTESKNKIREQFLAGQCRCVVTTAALAMGVNLPASHVLVRDLSYGIDGALTEGALLQMSGRAGRGNRPGQAFFLCRSNGTWNPSSLKEALNREYKTEVCSVLAPADPKNYSVKEHDPEPPLAKAILSLLARKSEKGMSLEELQKFLNATLAGLQSPLEAQPSLCWMADQNRILVFEENRFWKPTTLGHAVIRASLPLSVGTGVAELFRDIFVVDPTDRCLSEMKGLDILLLSELVASQKGIRARFTKKMREGVDQWMEQMGNPSLLYKEWIRGDRAHSKADELLGSLKLNKNVTPNQVKAHAHAHAYLSCFQAIILWQRAHGTSASDLERRWGGSVQGLDEFEEKWRDDRLFLIGALLHLWDVKVFYYHLKNDCEANEERIRRIKRGLQKLRAHSYQMLDLVGWCSPLGPVFTRLRSLLGRTGKANPSKGTMRQLEAHGVQSIKELQALDLAGYQKMGIRKDFAQKIMGFANR